MLVDAMAGVSASPLEIEAAAVEAERGGYDGFCASETRHDVFSALTLAARATSAVTLRSAIAVAFARNPMSVAVLANDLQVVSGGRFQLGLGSQVRGHIERRFAMPWSHPAARMEEFVAAIRAIWAHWAGAERLAFRGKFYEHTLMSDFFDPGPNPHGNPAVVLAAVGPAMTAAAGRTADGILCHSLTTQTYLRERTIPVLRQARGGDLTGFSVNLPVLVAVGATPQERAAAEKGVRGQIAFYASTPDYRAVLELHGWGALHERLNELAFEQDWAAMADLINDDVLGAFAIGGTADEVAAGLVRRYDGLVDRISLYTPYEADPDQIAKVTAGVRERSSGSRGTFSSWEASTNAEAPPDRAGRAGGAQAGAPVTDVLRAAATFFTAELDRPTPRS